MIRFEYEMQWLENHIEEVDRIFHADAFDVLFQKDPFSPEIKTNKLLFIVEPHCFRSCGWNLAWFNRCYNWSTLLEIRNHYIICSGSIIGGARSYLKLLQLMISQEEWSDCYDTSLDQPILNYLIWLGIARDHGIEYDFTGCDGNFMTMQWCQMDGSIPINKKRQIQSLEGNVPAFVHQYNRIENLTRDFYQYCHITPYPIIHNHNA